MSLDHDNSSTELISELNEYDVINGKGSYAQDQNAAHRDLVQFTKAAYAASPTTRQKDGICRGIVRTIRLMGGRFLDKRDNSDLWYETGNEKAIEKTKQAIRDANLASRRKEPQLFLIKQPKGARQLSIETATTASSSMSIGSFGSSSQSLSLHEESGQQQQQIYIEQMDIVTSAEHSPIRMLGARRLAILNILQTPFHTTASLPSCMSTETLESSGLISQDSIRTCQQEETDISSVEVSPRKTNNERISLRNKQFSVFFKKKTTKNT